MKKIPLVLLCILSFRFSYAQNDSLVSKKIIYTLPAGWGQQDRLVDGWADMSEPDAPYLILDYVLYDINIQEEKDKYINSWIETMKQDNPDVVKTGQVTRTINEATYTIVTVLYTKDNTRWQDLQYYTPKECGQICHGYAFTIRGPQALFDKMKPAIAAFEKSLQITK